MSPRYRLFARTQTVSTGGVLSRAQREALTFGAYRPDATNTGLLPAINRTVVAPSGGVLATTAAGQIIENQEILGTIKVNHADVIIRNCWVRGRTDLAVGATSYLIDLRFGATGNTLIEDCLIDPRDTLNWGQDAVRERGFTAKRLRIVGCTDQFSPNYSGSDATQSVNMNVFGCWTSGQAKNCPDSGHTDGTHNDCIQFVGGRNMLVRGNRFDGRLDPAKGNTGGRGITPGGPIGDPANCAFERTDQGVCTTGNAVLQFNQNAQYVNCVIENNWFDGGMNTCNAGALSTTFAHDITLQNNIFARRTPGPTGPVSDGVKGQYLPESGSGGIPPINMSATTVPGASITGNVFDDGTNVPGNRG